MAIMRADTAGNDFCSASSLSEIQSLQIVKSSFVSQIIESKGHSVNRYIYNAIPIEQRDANVHIRKRVAPGYVHVRYVDRKTRMNRLVESLEHVHVVNRQIK